MPETRHQTWRIGDVARLLGLQPYVLRFWETEFPQLSPLRTSTGQRLYTQEHVDLLRRIQYLVHERGLTIEGARREMADTVPPAPAATPAREAADSTLLRDIVAELEEMRQLLEGPGTQGE